MPYRLVNMVLLTCKKVAHLEDDRETTMLLDYDIEMTP